MDSTKDQSSQPSIEKQSESGKKLPNTPNKLLRNKKLLRIVGIILFLLLIIPVLTLFLSGGKSNVATQIETTITPAEKSKEIKTGIEPTTAIAKQSHTLVYGAWTSQSSVIRAVDVLTSKATTVATLPLGVKKVTIMSDKTLLYIDQTDNYDHGRRISIYNTQQKQIVVNIPATSGFGIDDYVLSPDKKYLTLWEVSFAPGLQVLQGGRSKVSVIDLSRPIVSNLLYDEPITATTPIHYPRAILNDGTVFTDKVIPNDPNGGAGWAYGMSVVDFDGTNKRDIDDMKAGTYSTQPSLSPGGKYLLFAGYDGTQGDGTAIKNGYRQALLTPNTIELLNTQTLQRFRLPNLPNANTYSSVQWDQQTGEVIISILSPDTKQMGVYTYDLGTLQAKQITMPVADGTPYHYVSQLTPSTTLIGLQSTDQENLGNLGENYAYAFTQMAIIGAKDALTYVSLQDPFIQYITILPSNYFHPVLGLQTAQPKTPTQPVVTKTTNQPNPKDLKRYSFFLKTRLAAIRAKAQSNPIGSTSALALPNVTKSTAICEQLAQKRCEAQGFLPTSDAFNLCTKAELANGQITSACYH